MKSVPRRRPIGFLTLGVFAGAWGSAGCRDECDDVGAIWCHGTSVQQCYRSGGGSHLPASNVIQTTDCSERDLICSEESGRARCVFEAPRCADKPEATEVCIGDVRAICELGASHPVPDVNCSPEHCVESERTARCSPHAELCADDEPNRCELGRVVSCVDQIWLSPGDSGGTCFGECSLEGATQCVEAHEPGRPPEEGVAKCIGQPGIWQAVGPVCQSGCACEGEQEACRCREWSADFEPF